MMYPPKNNKNGKTKIQDSITNRIEQYKEHLSTLNLKPELHIKISSTQFRSKDSVRVITDSITDNKSPKIYRFSIASMTQRKSLINAYTNFKEINVSAENSPKRSISRFNNNNNSETLYIGSKMTNIKSRIKEHLGEGYFRTYALQLNKWDNDLEYDLEIEIFTVQTQIQKDYKRNFIELVEQEMWEYYQPIFGKKSGL